MGRFSAAGRTTNAPTATLPGSSLYSAAASRVHVIEIGVFNTTTTACLVNLSRLTTAGTQGAAITEANISSPESSAATATAVNSHTSTPPTLGAELVRAQLAAAIGAGAVWTFDGTNLEIEKGTGNGIGLMCLTGTGQILDWYMIWDE